MLRFLARRMRELGVGGTVRQARLRARAAVPRARRAGYAPVLTRRLETPDAASLEELFTRHADKGVTTTLRNAAYLRWRYFDAPYRSNLEFYVAGPEGDPKTCAIVRYLPQYHEARILDLFGELAERELLGDLLRTILRDALGRDIDRVKALAAAPSVAAALRDAGLTRQHVRPFRWYSRDPQVNERFSTVPIHWVLGDSCLDVRE